MADAGEEELLLDALCVCMEPLKVLASVVNSAPAAANRPPDDVSLVALQPPFHLQLSCRTPAMSAQAASLPSQTAGHQLVLDVRLMCKGLVWIGFPLDAVGPAAQMLSSLRQSLSAMSGVSCPRDDVASDLNGVSDDAGAPAMGLWVNLHVLEAVLTSIVNHS